MGEGEARGRTVNKITLILPGVDLQAIKRMPSTKDPFIQAESEMA